MTDIKNTFLTGRMNKDVDSRLMPDGEYRDALNIKVSSSGGGDVGAVENVLSNKALTSLEIGSTVNTVGAFFDSTAAMIYWFVKSNLGSYVFEYDTILDTVDTVLEDTSAGILNFDEDFLITGVGVVVDSDSNRRLLTWTDNLNPIRCVNIATAKSYSANGFTDAQISLAKAPPLYPPTISLDNTATDAENNIEDRFLRFGHVYIYADGERSAISPFTETAFLPSSFSYDYAVSSNEGMINQFNKVTIGFNTGVAEVEAVEIVMKESNSTTVYSIETFNKEEESWGNDETQTFVFTNNKVYAALAEDQLKRLYDAVPLKAKALALLGNRIMLGNYTEGYNITDSEGGKIKIDFTVDVVSTEIASGTPTATMKSNRGYEVGIVYLDDYGRMTTVLTSADNTAFIENSDSINQNQLRVTLVNEPPSWATHYRFFLKQTRIDYQVIVPSIFYQDGVYVWVKIEADEINKFAEGDFIYVKADSSEVLDAAVQVRVIEVKVQEQNFLEEDDVTDVLQLAGTYFKIKVSGFRMSEDDFSRYETVSYGFRSNETSNNFSLASGASYFYVDQPVYYGTTGLDDITITGTYSGDEDIRYIIDINVQGIPDSFRWSNDEGLTYSADIPITGTAQFLENGLSVTFGATTGHALDDNWIVPAKSGTESATWDKEDPVGDRRAIVRYMGKPVFDERIKGGATISISYDDTGSSSGSTNEITFTQVFNATKDYANIEEWFYGDNIISSITYPTDIDRVMFRRGTQFHNDPPERLEIDGRYTNPGVPDKSLCMCWLSSAQHENSNGERVRVDASMFILELKSNIIFETIPDNFDSELYFEIGRTYDITGGYHLGFDGNDTDQEDGVDGEFILDTSNAFAWGNGFESYKIKDLFNSNSMKIDTRPSGTILNYGQNVRIADITYSKVFEQSLNFNGLNEFNLSTTNYKSMDDRYGSIQKLFSAETDLEVYQEEKVHYVLYNKDLILGADGTGTLKETTNVLGDTAVPWSGEYGISTHPESHAFYGNLRYFTDVRRGVIIRRSADGITEINSGMSTFLRDSFRDNLSTRKFGGYDLHDKEYVFHDEGEYTLAFDEGVGGFPSFYSFQPEWMGSLNGQFYSFKNGQLYRHYDKSNSTRNNFYGVDYDSTMKLIVSKGPSDIKVLKTLKFEGNKAWATTIKSYLNDETADVTQSTLAVDEFLNKEGKFYGYIRRNELSGDTSAKDVYGVGQVTSVATSVISISNSIAGLSLRTGDNLYNSSGVLIGEITEYDTIVNTITVDTTPTIVADTFVYGKKDGRVEGSQIRGYNFEIDIVDSSNTRTELFAVESNVIKSLPS